MNTSQTYIDLIRMHQSELQERFGITSMRLFGSVARGDQHPGSDIDLFVTMPPKLYNYIGGRPIFREASWLQCRFDTRPSIPAAFFPSTDRTRWHRYLYNSLESSKICFSRFAIQSTISSCGMNLIRIKRS